MPGNECDGFESKALSAVRAGDEEMEDCHSVSARIEVCFFFFFSVCFQRKIAKPQRLSLFLLESSSLY